MLGETVVDEDVGGVSGGAGDSLCDDAVAFGGYVWAAYADVGGVREGVGEVHEPVFIGIGVVVEIGDEFAGGGGQACVSGCAEAHVLRVRVGLGVGVNDLGSEFSRDFSGVVG